MAVHARGASHNHNTTRRIVCRKNPKNPKNTNIYIVYEINFLLIYKQKLSHRGRRQHSAAFTTSGEYLNAYMCIMAMTNHLSGCFTQRGWDNAALAVLRGSSWYLLVSAQLSWKIEHSGSKSTATFLVVEFDRDQNPPLHKRMVDYVLNVQDYFG